MPVSKSIVAVMALAYVLAATGGAAEIVVCIGPDGHVAIEYAAGGACTSYACEKTERPSADSDIRPTVPSDSHCGSCIDIPFGAGEVNKQPVLRGTSPSANPHLVPGFQSVVVGPATTHAAGATAQICLFSNTTLTHLRTVYLLT